MSKKNENFFKEKKQWSEVKDALLGCYFKPYFAKISSTLKPLCYIDCFAGKGKFEDGKDGSPLIVQKIISSMDSSIRNYVKLYFIELNHATELENNLIELQNQSVSCQVVSGRFEDNINIILNKNQNSNVFLYIDPYGIKALDIPMLNSFARLFNSVELLINFNTFGFIREACRVKKANKILDEELFEFLIEYDTSNVSSIQELNRIAGGTFWQDIIDDYISDVISVYEAERRIADGIQKSFSNYKYVLNMPIKAKDHTTPKYRMFFVTNHNEGCLLMVDNMFRRSKESQISRNNGQICLFSLDVEGELINDEEIAQKILSMITNKEIRLNDLLSSFFVEFGIVADSKKVKEILKKYEENNIINIRREPMFTSKGKLSKFMTDESKQNGQKVFVRRARQ